MSRDEFVHGLSGVGVGTSVHFHPATSTHILARLRTRCRVGAAGGIARISTVVSLPIFSKMTDAQVDKVIDSVRELLT